MQLAILVQGSQVSNHGWNIIHYKRLCKCTQFSTCSSCWLDTAMVNMRWCRFAQGNYINTNVKEELGRSSNLFFPHLSPPAFWCELITTQQIRSWSKPNKSLCMGWTTHPLLWWTNIIWPFFWGGGGAIQPGHPDGY